MRVFCKTTNSFITNIDKGVFYSLEHYLLSTGEGSDKDDFATIKAKLKTPPTLNAADFAAEVIYIILASGFRQKIAKQKFAQILSFIGGIDTVIPEQLLPIFGNKNKINAICKVWNNKEKYCHDFYMLDGIDKRLDFLGCLPYIGEITKNHLARNLGINMVKYDVWIQRLGICLCGGQSCTVGTPLSRETQIACDKMFDYVHRQTGEPIGFIDVVLWKSCQIGLLEFI